METVTLRNRTADDRDVKRRCLVFTGEEGVEGLIQTKTRFNNVAHALQLEEGHELFDNFEQVLSDNAETRWQNLVAEIADEDRTDVRFEDEYQNLLDSYATNRGRDYMRDYLQSTEVKKPYDADCAEHKERLTTLVKYTNMLSGTQDQIEPNDEKHIIFKSFPDKWQQAYILSGHNYMTQTLDEIVQYMSNKKIEQDQKDKDERRRSARQPREARSTRYSSQYQRNNMYHPYENVRNSNRYQYGNFSGRFTPRFNHGGRGNGGRTFDRTGRGRFPSRNFYQRNYHNNHYNQTNGRAPYNPGMGGRGANRDGSAQRDGNAQNFFAQRGRYNDYSGRRQNRGPGYPARAAHQVDVHHFDAFSPPQEYYQAEETDNLDVSPNDSHYPDNQYPAEQDQNGWY